MNSQHVPLGLLLQLQQMRQQREQMDPAAQQTIQQMMQQQVQQPQVPQAVDQKYSVNEKFLRDFHDDVIRRKRGLVEDGTTTTMRLGSFSQDGKTYLVPMYDPESQRVMDWNEVIDRWQPAIRSGQLVGFDSVEEAEAFREKIYPNIINGVR